MNIDIKNIIDPKLYEIISELVKEDIILQSALDKSETVSQFINSLLAAIICMTERHLIFQDTVKKLLDSNPQVQKILYMKQSESGITNDQLLLSEKSKD